MKFSVHNVPFDPKLVSASEYHGDRRRSTQRFSSKPTRRTRITQGGKSRRKIRNSKRKAHTHTHTHEHLAEKKNKKIRSKWCERKKTTTTKPKRSTKIVTRIQNSKREKTRQSDRYDGRTTTERAAAATERQTAQSDGRTV